jgi:hypothetical protein
VNIVYNSITMAKQFNTITIIVVLLSAQAAFSAEDAGANFFKMMDPIHASGTGLSEFEGQSAHTGAYALKDNGYDYDPQAGYEPDEGPYEFWSINFGANQSLRKFTLGVDGSGWYNHFDGFSWTSFYGGFGDYADDEMTGADLGELLGTSIIYATESDLGRVATGHPDFSTGICNINYGGVLRASSFVLNPAELTFNGVTYSPGQLALVVSIDGSFFTNYRKVVLLYDLRQIGEQTDRQPDYNTGQDGLGGQSPIYGAYYQTDWNDCFYPLVTGADILASIPDAGTVASTFNYGRQAVWAPDASAIYFAGFTINQYYSESDPDDVRYWNGIWKYDFADGELTWIKREPDRENRMYYCEMAAVHTSVRDFTGGAEEGVQILYVSETENVGGISCIVDNGQIDPPVYTVVDINELSAVTGKLPGFIEVDRITASPQGDLYFYCTSIAEYVSTAGGSMYQGPYGLFKYDMKNRLYAVANRAHFMNFNVNEGDTISGSTSAVGCFQYYSGMFGREIIAFRNTALGVPCGVEIFEPGDFNQDGAVDINDLIIFRDQRIDNDRWLDPKFSGDPAYEDNPDVMPGIFEVSGDYINCDITGSSMYRNILIDDSTGLPVSDEVLADLENLIDPEGSYTVISDKEYFREKCVTAQDAELLYEFIPAGDADLNGKVDFLDYAKMFLYYGSGNSTDDRKDFSQGDFDFDGDVDAWDLILFAEYWLVDVNQS